MSQSLSNAPCIDTWAHRGVHMQAGIAAIGVCFLDHTASVEVVVRPESFLALLALLASWLTAAPESIPPPPHNSPFFCPASELRENPH